MTQWWCFTTAPGTLGVTRHLLGLVSLGPQIEGFIKNRQELNIYHLLSYYLLNHSRCQVPDIKSPYGHSVITRSPTSVQVNNKNNVNLLSTLMPCTSITCIIFTSYYLKYNYTHATYSRMPPFQMVTKICPSRCKKDYFMKFCLAYPYIINSYTDPKII